MLKQYYDAIVSLLARRTHLPAQFISFLMVGVLNTAVGYALYAFFILLGFNYIFAPLCSTVLGVLFNFQTIGRIVFCSHDNRLIGRFLGVYALVYLFNVLGLKGFSSAGVENLYIAGAILTFPLALLSFILNKIFVFNGE